MNRRVRGHAFHWGRHGTDGFLRNKFEDFTAEAQRSQRDAEMDGRMKEVFEPRVDVNLKNRVEARRLPNGLERDAPATFPKMGFPSIRAARQLISPCSALAFLGDLCAFAVNSFIRKGGEMAFAVRLACHGCGG
jgi:hypothetical protein